MGTGDRGAIGSATLAATDFYSAGAFALLRLLFEGVAL